MENNNELSLPEEQPDLLANEAYDLNHYVYASQGQRFLNWLIDNLFMNYILGYATGFGIGIILGLIAPEFLNKIATAQAYGQRISEFYLFAYMLGAINYLLYYTLCEKLFKGYTLGKIITGTRAIRQDGGELTFKNAVLRSLSRLVPFEVFSGFSTLAWHDSWTDTMVIKSR
jgi:uncharacterized RDD family membrane protein YckC